VDRSHRLTRGVDFQKVRQHGRSWAHPLLILRVGPGSTSTRFGLIVSKKIGKAHDRNRVKRRLREICRRYVPAMASACDIVLIARPEIASATFEQVGSAVEQLFQRARLLRPMGQASPR